MSNVSFEELQYKAKQFMDKYRFDYANAVSEETYFLEMPLDKWFDYNYISAYYEPMGDECFFNQIFCAMEILPDERNEYLKMVKKIENEYGLDRNIIEVGGGFFPALSYEIAKRQKEIGKGTITVYDKQTIPHHLEGIKIVKRNFTLATPVEEGSLLVGRKPCNASEIIIRSANDRNIEFFISLCNCSHTPIEYVLSHQKANYKTMWFDYLENIARSTLPDNFDFKRVEENTQYEEEIIIKTKKLK